MTLPPHADASAPDEVTEFFEGARATARRPVESEPDSGLQEDGATTRGIPVFDTPAAVHPRIEEIEAASLAWMRSTGLLATPELCDRWRRDRLGAIACHLYPYSGQEDADLYACWYSWWFYMDNLLLKVAYHEWTTLAMEVERVVRRAGATNHSAPVLNALAQLCRRTADSCSPDLYQWIVTGCGDALDGLNIEAFGHHTGRMPDLGNFGKDSEYLTIRRKSLGMLFDTGLMEHAARFTVPARLRRSPQWQQALETGFDVIILQNDIHGLMQDIAEGEMHNAVYLLHKQHEIELDRARDEIADVIRRKVADFLDAEKALHDTARQLNLPPEDISNACDVLAKVKVYSQGALAWYRETDRYNGEAH